MQQREEAGEPRFGMLGVIHEYALERLEASGETEALRRAHAVYYLALAERAEPQLTGPEVGAWLDRLEREHDNLRAALVWAREQRDAVLGLRLAAALRRFWWIRGYMREGRAWVEVFLALMSSAEIAAAGVTAGVRARALLAGGTLALWLGDDVAAGAWLEEALAFAQEAGNQRTSALILNAQGILAKHENDLEKAYARFEAFLSLARQMGDLGSVCIALTNLGDISIYQGELDRAEAVFVETLALDRAAGDLSGVAVDLLTLSLVARKRGEVSQSEAMGREGLALVRNLGDRRRCAEAIEQLATATAAVGQGARSARSLGAAAAMRNSVGAQQPVTEREDIEEALAPTRAAMGETAWAAAFSAGQELTLEEAIAEALQEGSTSE